ncbi:hypothetical protein Tco_1259630 [Tanacetum coccineum]
MCKAYGGEPSLELLRAFLNLGLAGDWLTLSNRGGSGIPKALIKPGGVGDGEEESPSNKSINNEAPVIDVNPLNSSPPSHVAENVEDSDDVSSKKGIIDEAERLCKSSKATCKRKQVTGMSVKDARRKLQKAPPQASKVVGDVSNPLDVDSDHDIHEFPFSRELKDSADCHFVVAQVTPPSWKQHLKDISLEKLCDIHDRVYMRQAVLDNMLNSWTRQLMYALAKARASCDIETLQGQVDKLHESERERLKGSKTQLLQEIDKLRQDRTVLVTKVIPHVAMKLIRSDEVGLLATRLVKVAIFRGRCTTFEEVAILKEPFTLEKMLGYLSSYVKEFNQAGDELATASYPFISEAPADPYASLKELLSKKPKAH